MRLGDERGHELGLETRVDLQLGAPRANEPVDHRRDVLGTVDAQGAERLRAVAVDQAVDDDARADATAGVDGVAYRRDELHDVAFVAHGGDAGGEVDRGLLDLLDVGVHVPEAGQD